MKLKGAILLIVLPIILTAIFLMPSSENYAGIYVLALCVGGMVLTGCFSQPVIASLCLVIAMHMLQLEGIYLCFFLLMLANLVYVFMGIVRAEVKADLYWCAPPLVLIGYLGIVILKHPYDVHMTCFYMYSMALVLFAAMSLIRWDPSRVQCFLSAHLFYMVAWAVIEYILGINDRVGGPSLSATNFAALLATSWTIWVINGWMSKETRGPILVIGTIAVCVCIILSGSRMGFIGIAVGGLCGIVSIMLKGWKGSLLSLFFKIMAVMGGLVVLAIVIWTILPDDILIKQGFKILASGKLDRSSWGRLGVWATAVDVIRSHPMWGCGPGNFKHFNEMFLDQFAAIPAVRYIPRLPHAHNIILMTLAEQGIVGCIALAGFCSFCFRELLLYIKKMRDGFGFALLSGAVVFMTLGMVDVFPLFPSSLGWGAWYMGVLFSLRSFRSKNQ